MRLKKRSGGERVNNIFIHFVEKKTRENLLLLGYLSRNCRLAMLDHYYQHLDIDIRLYHFHETAKSCASKFYQLSRTRGRILREVGI